VFELLYVIVRHATLINPFHNPKYEHFQNVATFSAIFSVDIFNTGKKYKRSHVFLSVFYEIKLFML
jgi:hypothetical protein